MRAVKFAALIVVTGLTFSLACGSDDAADTPALSLAAAQALVEAELPGLATEFGDGVPATETIYELIEAYLSANPEFFGATFAVDPSQTANAAGASPYVFRGESGLERKDLAAVEGYDFTTQEWYARPMASGLPLWSDEYFDAGGGEINMITYSIPVLMGADGGVFIGVLTTDLATDDRPAD